MKTTLPQLLLIALLPMISCKDQSNGFDATGSFEAEETVISAEGNGILQQFTVQEGQQLKLGQTLGYIDTIQLYLRKKQLAAQIQALLSKRPNVGIQLAVLEEQLTNAQSEQQRITKLVSAKAAGSKQLDDITNTIELLKKQIDAQKSSLNISIEGISKESYPLEIQIEQINDQIKKCIITNPLEGTVLNKFAEQNEMTNPGKPLYKIADLSYLTLRCYVSGNQIPQIKLNQKVKVHTDNGEGAFNETEGEITWINDKAEFTPKTVQTKDERANMVYAVKVKVKNNGSLKIGMYGEIKFN